MAINESIPLQVQAPGIMGAAIGGLQAGQQFAANKQEMQKQDNAMNVQALKFAHDTAVQLKAAPVEQRAQIVSTALPQLQKMGIDVQGMNLDQHLDDNSLDSFISATKPYTVVPGQRIAGPRVVGNETIIDKNGTAYAQSRVFDQGSGKMNIVETALGPSSSITNRMGQTADDQYTTALRLKQQQDAYAAQKELEVAGGKAQIGVNTAAPLEAEKKAAEQRSTYKTQAVAAAENIPTLERAIDLNSKVVTGGSQSALQAAANYLGIASSDPGELRSLLNQNILGQLKSTFGGNPTEGERAALGQAQASFDQSGYVNKSLLDNALKLARMRVNRGKQAAYKDKDAETIKYIDDALSVKLGETPTEKTPKAAPAAKTEREVQWGDIK